MWALKHMQGLTICSYSSSKAQGWCPGSGGGRGIMYVQSFLHIPSTKRMLEDKAFYFTIKNQTQLANSNS